MPGPEHRALIHPQPQLSQGTPGRLRVTTSPFHGGSTGWICSRQPSDGLCHGLLAPRLSWSQTDPNPSPGIPVPNCASRSQTVHPSPTLSQSQPRVLMLVASEGPLGTGGTPAGLGTRTDPPGAVVGLCFWLFWGGEKGRSCRLGRRPLDHVGAPGCGRGLFTVIPGPGPGSKPQMNSSCRGRSQTAPGAGGALGGGPELLEQEGCGASPRSCHVREPHARGSPRGDSGSSPSATSPGTRHGTFCVSKLWKTALSLVASAWPGAGASGLRRRCHLRARQARLCSQGAFSHPTLPFSLLLKIRSDIPSVGWAEPGAVAGAGSTQPLLPWLRSLLALGMLDSFFLAPGEW